MSRLFEDEYGNLYPALAAAKEIVIIVVLFALAMMVLTALIAAPIMGIEALVANNKCEDLTSYDAVHEYRWGFFSGCRVKTGLGYWVDADNPALIELEQGE